MLTTIRKTDAEIEQQVVAEMRWDCRTEGGAIQVTVQDGKVTLSGRVKNYAIKHAAEEATQRIAGVQAIRNEIVIKIPYLQWQADIEIAENAAQIFEWNVLIPHEQVSAVVTAGVVELVGEVECWSQRQEVERAIITLQGVKGITNNIRVKESAVEPEQLRKAIKATLVRHSLEEAEHIQVAMEDGAVRLTGEVPTWGERFVVVTAAGFAPGVRQIVDDLKIAVNA